MKKRAAEALHSLFVWDEEGSLVIENDVEDIHSQIEKEMSSILGNNREKKFIQDDQETTRCWFDIRLYTREEIDKLSVLIRSLF